MLASTKLLRSAAGRSAAAASKWRFSNHSSSSCNTTAAAIIMATRGTATTHSFDHLNDREGRIPPLVLAAATLLAAAAASAATTASAVTLCDEESSSSSAHSSSFTPSSVAREDFQAVVSSHNIDDMPVYSAEQLAENDGTDGKPMWMSYGGVIYNVTNFVANHPGGSEKIVQAAGSAIEPFWYLYRQHFASDLPMRLMEHMAIGRLKDEDQAAIDAQMEVLELDDPYAREPERHAKLRVHSDAPMNAEVPSQELTQSYLTPNDLFYIRHHHPVPYMTEKQIHEYRLKVDLTAYGGDVVQFTMDDLKKLPRTEITATLQCSGNRRGGYNAFQRTSGTPWGTYCTKQYNWVWTPLLLLQYPGGDRSTWID